MQSFGDGGSLLRRFLVPPNISRAVYFGIISLMVVLGGVCTKERPLNGASVDPRIVVELRIVILYLGHVACLIPVLLGLVVIVWCLVL